jgi:hypothetical protein
MRWILDTCRWYAGYPLVLAGIRIMRFSIQVEHCDVQTRIPLFLLGSIIKSRGIKICGLQATSNKRSRRLRYLR